MKQKGNTKVKRNFSFFFFSFFLFSFSFIFFLLFSSSLTIRKETTKANQTKLLLSHSSLFFLFFFFSSFFFFVFSFSLFFQARAHLGRVAFLVQYMLFIPNTETKKRTPQGFIGPVMVGYWSSDRWALGEETRAWTWCSSVDGVDPWWSGVKASVCCDFGW